ncbi:hypothetical protein FHS90_004578 [Rufibacter quisquiliarum]|uniref:Uncharacterized protein n=1 Tax=Rufibacter quisquiliarum TaxID=1549639 RepID=A0A839GYD6_9BACT|nr:hypothetical protein [Rufibacter quisquiliarum]
MKTYLPAHLTRVLLLGFTAFAGAGFRKTFGAQPGTRLR